MLSAVVLPFLFVVLRLQSLSVRVPHSWELLRTSHVDDLLERISRYPERAAQLTGTMTTYERLSLFGLALACVLQIVLAFAAGGRSDSYGAVYAAMGTIFSLFAFGTVTALGLLLLLLSEAHAADYDILRQAIKKDTVGVKIARREYNEQRRLFSRTGEAASGYHGILFCCALLTSFLYVGLLLFAPTRADLVRSFFATPVLLLVLWTLLLMRGAANVTSAGTRLVSAAQQGFVAEGVERKASFSLYLTVARTGLHAYGYVIDRRFLLLYVMAIAFTALLLLQRLLSLVLWHPQAVSR